MKTKQLKVYLQDHYAGGVSAIELLEHLSKANEDKPIERGLQQMLSQIEWDHDQLHLIMQALGFDESRIRDAGAWMGEKFGRVKLGFGSAAHEQLRLLQALEILMIGITGKKLMWRTLRELVSYPELKVTDFDYLERRALEQLDELERWRLEIVSQEVSVLPKEEKVTSDLPSAEYI